MITTFRTVFVIIYVLVIIAGVISQTLSTAEKSKTTRDTWGLIISVLVATVVHGYATFLIIRGIQ